MTGRLIAVMVMFVASWLTACKTTTKSELAGKDKVQRSSSMSICSKTLNHQWRGRFGQIAQCAVDRGCISGGKKSIYCKKCDQNNESLNFFGAYRYPESRWTLVKQEIYFCERYVDQDPTDKKWDESFLEEAYHAATICPKGKPASIALTKGLSYLDEVVKSKQITPKDRECIACLAQEFLAKDCALRAMGNEVLLDKDFEAGLTRGYTTASSSCGDYCPDRNNLGIEDTRNTPEFVHLRPFAQNVKKYCEEVDRTCN